MNKITNSGQDFPLQVPDDEISLIAASHDEPVKNVKRI